MVRGGKGALHFTKENSRKVFEDFAQDYSDTQKNANKPEKFPYKALFDIICFFIVTLLLQKVFQCLL